MLVAVDCMQSRDGGDAEAIRPEHAVYEAYCWRDWWFRMGVEVSRLWKNENLRRLM